MHPSSPMTLCFLITISNFVVGTKAHSIAITGALIILLKSLHLLFFPFLFPPAPSCSSFHLETCRPSQPTCKFPCSQHTFYRSHHFPHRLSASFMCCCLSTQALLGPLSPSRGGADT
uniref:Secreted protein n=1 Tax=Triticum urartu TaxID=4572 RepID=A0A8R7TBH8_TRIUA